GSSSGRHVVLCLAVPTSLPIGCLPLDVWISSGGAGLFRHSGLPRGGVSSPGLPDGLLGWRGCQYPDPGDLSVHCSSPSLKHDTVWCYLFCFCLHGCRDDSRCARDPVAVAEIRPERRIIRLLCVGGLCPVVVQVWMA